jgi:hypothetical protein
MGAGTWIILGIGAIAVYMLFINPTNRRLLQGFGEYSTTGDKNALYRASRDVARSDPNAAARLKGKNPNLYNKIQQDNAFYGYRY